MVKSAKCEERDELMDRTSSKENGKAMVPKPTTFVLILKWTGMIQQTDQITR
jgi:hypothetical protein